jgi:predicted neuraminidase
MPDQNGTLFIDPQGRLWLFWVSSMDNEVRGYFIKYRYSTNYEGDGAPIWDWQDALFCRPKDVDTALPEILEARAEEVNNTAWVPEAWKKRYFEQIEERKHMYEEKLFQRLGWLPRQPPIMLSETRMMLGLYSDVFDCSMFAFTEDGGKTWEFSRPVASFGIQPATVQRKNGDLVSYLRMAPVTRCIESRDGGMTWEEVPLDIPNSGTSVAALALQSGHWLLAVNDVPSGRHQLSLYYSQDEGATWERKRFLEQLDPEAAKVTASYPTLIQGTDGMIHITYTYQNEAIAKGKSIKHAAFDEAWVRAGTDHR